ncbi:MAG TPA: S8 family peptidase, partial [Chloroflexia bacterium]|nr:S8 family peptidase [Chloroflexia bacterium]
MLRKFTACLSLISLMMVSGAPLTVFGKTTASNNNRQARQNKKLAPELESSSTSNGTIRVIIQTKGQPSAEQDNAIANTGGTKRASYSALNAVVADVPASSVASLAARADVEYVTSDRPMQAQGDLMTTTGADSVQQGLAGMPGFTGKGITIAVLDSGISAKHPDFNGKGKSRVLTSVDFTGSQKAGDPYGHGTGVASVAAGSGEASKGYGANYAGIAPQASLVDLRVIDENGAGRASSVISALNWVIQNKATYNIRVVNLSAGGAIYESFRQDPVCQAVARAYMAGIVVVTSAGNYGRTTKVMGYDNNGKEIYQLAYGTITSPANSPYAITVGAADTRKTVQRSDDFVADFSSKGPTQIDHLAKPDVVAPGTRIMAAMSQETTEGFYSPMQKNIQQPTTTDALPNAYFKYSGTSFAAPVVSGTVALMLEANSSLTPGLVKAALKRTAQTLPGVRFGNRELSIVTQGAGMVNAIGATS